MSCWQTQWNECENNKLRSISPRVKANLPINMNTRRDEVLIHRCLVGHTRPTNSQLTLTNQPQYVKNANTPLW